MKVPLKNMSNIKKIGLALSGGGSRAIAFHLGCLRALNNRGILGRLSIMSTVSGGSVIGAMYAYSDDSFEKFDKRVVKLLSKGLVKGIIKNILFSRESIKILGTLLFSGSIAIIIEILTTTPYLKSFFKKIVNRAPFRRFSSRTLAFENYLDKLYFNNLKISDVKRGNFDMIINATELITQTAIRFGSKRSWTWRHGELTEEISISKAVAASASYPALLPAIDDYFKFEKDGKVNKKRVIISDGGIYDNLGTSVFFSNSPKSQSEKVDYVIACVAGHGLPDGSARPYSWFTRMSQALFTTHKRTEDMMKNLIHEKFKNQEINGFIMPFLGQLDESLPIIPPDLVTKDMVYGYPTDFYAMNKKDIDLLAKRGEQLTNILIDSYQPEL